MPLHEIKERFTFSEIVITSWRSQEISYQLSKSTKTGASDVENHNDRLEDLPTSFYNENGELDLRKATGPQAYKFFQNMGINIPIYDKR